MVSNNDISFLKFDANDVPEITQDSKPGDLVHVSDDIALVIGKTHEELSTGAKVIILTFFGKIAWSDQVINTFCFDDE